MNQTTSLNDIHPTVIVEGDVKIGKKNKILPYSILIGPLEIGDNNIIGPNVIIGSPGQDTKNPRHDCSDKKIFIGNNNIIREFSAIQKPCYRDLTELKNDIYIMQGVHVPHDAIIEDKAVITPMVAMGGITRILMGANIGIGCSLHQFTVVGQYSMVAMGAAINKNVKPFTKYIPGKPLKLNTVAIERYSLNEHLDEIEKYVFHNVYPKNDKLLRIVDHFERFHSESKRSLY